MVDKAIDRIMKSNREVVLCNFDTKKAYDHVDKPFFIFFLFQS